MFCTWSAWQKPIVILTAPHPVRHVNGSAVCMWGGKRGSAAGWELSVFEVGIWSSHLHLMPFRLLVLTRAKHLTRLGLIWWGHGMTPWPPLSMFAKWNQLSHRAGEGWRGVGRGSASWLDWPEDHWASLARQSGAPCFAARRTLCWCDAHLPAATEQLLSQAKHLVKTHSIDLERITNAPASYRSTFHFEDVCKSRLRQYTFSGRCVWVCVCDLQDPY